MGTFPVPAPIGTLSAVGKVMVILMDDGEGRQFTIRVELENATGEVLRAYDGDLTDYITAGQAVALGLLMDGLRAKAASEMLA